MPRGTVKFFNHKARFGFIRVDETGQEIYTRKSRLMEEIHDGDVVEFNIEPGRKGDEAVDVKVIEKAAGKPEASESQGEA